MRVSTSGLVGKPLTEAQVRAGKITCPVCGAPPRHWCETKHGDQRVKLHRKRLEEATE